MTKYETEVFSVKDDSNAVVELGKRGYRVVGIIQSWVDSEGFTYHPQVIMERAIEGAE